MQAHTRNLKSKIADVNIGSLSVIYKEVTGTMVCASMGDGGLRGARLLLPASQGGLPRGVVPALRHEG